MTYESPPNSEKNLTNELAKERNRAAAERTLMAWIRTCLSLISFGVGINGIIEAVYRVIGGNQAAPPIGITRVTALAFVGLGTVAIIAATLEHRLILQKIQRNDFTSSHRTSLALIVACFLCGIGLFAFLGLVIKASLGGG
jgi:putative membrane protein